MSHHSSFTTFDLKEKKSQLLVVVILVLLLPVLLYLLQQALSLRGRAAGETQLRLVPKNIAQAPDGTWKFTKGQEVEIDVVLESGTNQIESVEPVIFYDKDSLSLKNSNPSLLSTQNMYCNDFTPLKHKVSSVIGGLTIDQNGIEQGTEFGFASIGCTIYPPSNPALAETPPPAGFSAPVATFKFTPKQIGAGKTITFGFTPGSVNDSSAYKYEGGCCSQTNVLQLVENLTYDVVEAQQEATLAFSPASGNFTVGQEFQVQVNLSTGQYAVDAVDTVIDYNEQDLELVGVEEGTIFPSYILNPQVVAGAVGRIEITSQVNPSSLQGFRGNNQLFATLTFKALRPTNSTSITFFIDPQDSHNDTNIVQFRQGVDVLSSVGNAQYAITIAASPTPTIPAATPTPDPFPAMLRLSPTGGNQVVGQPFTVSVTLTTGTDRVDSVDAIIQYDSRYLRLTNTDQNSAFESESTRESDPGSADPMRTITLIHQVGVSSSGITGSDLPLATLTFEPLQVVAQTPVTIVYEDNGSRNDSNVVKFRSGIDLLGHIENGNYTIVTSANLLVESIRFKIALQGRLEEEKSQQKELAIKILGTHFEQNPLTLQTDVDGEASASSQLEGRVERRWYTMLIKPKGYLQRRVAATLDDANNIVDLTGEPFKAGDLDNSGFINSFDWTKFLRAFTTPDPEADITGDGLFNSFDNTYILLNWFGEDEQ